MAKRLAAVVAVLGLQSTSGMAAPRSVEATFIGMDGSRYDLTDQKGRWVLMNYLATWCGPCIEEIPTLSKLSRLSRDGKDLRVMTVTDERPSPAGFQAFVAAHPASHARMDVAPGSISPDLPSTFLGMRMRPITHLIRPDGTIARRFIGDLDASDIEFVETATR